MHNAIEIAPIVDAILVVGGDGTMSDVAYSLYESGISTPIIGIGSGSTNAGPLITVKSAELDTLDTDALTVKDVGGILATIRGEKCGLGFNDIVFGDTVLSTLHERVVQVSAADYLKGKKVPAPPSKAGTIDSEVLIERSGKVIQIHKGEFGQMFAAPLEKRYLGKGLAGGTSLAAALGLPAGIAITSEPLINYSIGADDLLNMEPIITRTASFRINDEVLVRGLKDGTSLNIDGNPIIILEPDDEVHLSYIPDAAKVLKQRLK
ncbi:MAG: diacylglycerol kinase family protein, partial [Candidatus Methanoperedens sp.]|nr:diacylglycerol kinase family protein [Candidatus Methanoperedens sp.]